MCGIWALLGYNYDSHHYKEFLKIASRGPDSTVVQNVQPNVWFGFHRLAIVQPGKSASQQPISYKELSVICNGELYNHEDIKAKSDLSEVINDASDCSAIIHAFVVNKGDLIKTCSSLDGVFAFVMADGKNLYLGRDPIGVRPLFYGFTDKGEIVVGSAIKSIENLCEVVHVFPPGCCTTIPIDLPVQAVIPIQYYFIPTLFDVSVSMKDTQILIRQTLISAVKKRLMGERLFGFMLSGGLDSSLIAAVTCKLLKSNCVEAFSVGFENSPDIENAKLVAEFLGIKHHILTITPEQCITAIPEVIYALETFDPLIVRCGIVHYLLCKYIAEKSDVKVLLSGEGADELFGSYSYMQSAPSLAYLHDEIIRRMKLLHHYDVLRCDRATSEHGLEIRVPFLDKAFINLVARLPPSLKKIRAKLEKHILRCAFTGWLPNDILWRSKEGFAEALGKYDLGAVVNEHAELAISDEDFAQRKTNFVSKTPETKEEYLYRTLFNYYFIYDKVHSTIHTKVYRTAAWLILAEDSKCSYDAKKLQTKRLRRRSTGSWFLNAVA